MAITNNKMSNLLWVSWKIVTSETAFWSSWRFVLAAFDSCTFDCSNIKRSVRTKTFYPTIPICLFCVQQAKGNWSQLFAQHRTFRKRSNSKTQESFQTKVCWEQRSTQKQRLVFGPRGRNGRRNGVLCVSQDSISVENDLRLDLRWWLSSSVAACCCIVLAAFAGAIAIFDPKATTTAKNVKILPIINCETSRCEQVCGLFTPRRCVFACRLCQHRKIFAEYPAKQIRSFSNARWRKPAQQTLLWKDLIQQTKQDLHVFLALMHFPIKLRPD